MNNPGSLGKVFVVDSNLLFVKRLSDALREEGFEPVHCAEAAYALTMIEWNMPAAILCSLGPRDSTGFEIPAILREDAKTSHIPVIAIGDRGQRSQLEVLRAGYEDFLDRRLAADEIAVHVTALLASRRNGFQPTQMLAPSETALDGKLSSVDLPGVIQILSQSRQTGGLHINADSADGIIFFDAGEIIHAESGQFAGDEAIIHLVKSCYLTKDGVYKFIPGDAGALRTIQGTLNALILDALRELDEEERVSESVAEASAPPQPATVQSDAPVETVAAPDNAEGNTLSVNTGRAHEIETEIIETTPSKPDPDAGPNPGAEVESDRAPSAVEQTSFQDTHHLRCESGACEPIINESDLRELEGMLAKLSAEEEASHE